MPSSRARLVVATGVALVALPVLVWSVVELWTGRLDAVAAVVPLGAALVLGAVVAGWKLPRLLARVLLSLLVLVALGVVWALLYSSTYGSARELAVHAACLLAVGAAAWLVVTGARPPAR